jgi:hypothetical protein
MEIIFKQETSLDLIKHQLIFISKNINRKTLIMTSKKFSQIKISARKIQYKY